MDCSHENKTEQTTKPSISLDGAKAGFLLGLKEEQSDLDSGYSLPLSYSQMASAGLGLGTRSVELELLSFACGF